MLRRAATRTDHDPDQPLLRYLTGDRFTAADLTFAALAAPIVMPPDYSVPLPGPDELPAGMAAVVRELREHPAGAHALAMFREQRR